MEYRRYDNHLVLRLEIGEEVIDSIKYVCEKEEIRAGIVTGIGASNHVVIGLFKPVEKKYYSNLIEEDLEITNLSGNVSFMNGETYLHLHGTFADINGRAIGGHLNKAVISATAEIIITIINGKINRKLDYNTNLNLIDFKEN